MPSGGFPRQSQSDLRDAHVAPAERHSVRRDQVMIRMTRKQRDLVDAAAEATGQSRSEFIRTAVGLRVGSRAWEAANDTVLERQDA